MREWSARCAQSCSAQDLLNGAFILGMSRRPHTQSLEASRKACLVVHCQQSCRERRSACWRQPRPSSSRGYIGLCERPVEKPFVCPFNLSGRKRHFCGAHSEHHFASVFLYFAAACVYDHSFASLYPSLDVVGTSYASAQAEVTYSSLEHPVQARWKGTKCQTSSCLKHIPQRRRHKVSVALSYAHRPGLSVAGKIIN